MSRLLKQLGHQVMVANARKLRAISQMEFRVCTVHGSSRVLATALQRLGPHREADLR